MDPSWRQRLQRVSPSSLILAEHTALSAFVALHAYPATQDGPAHLYAAHVLRSLRDDPNSPFSAAFRPNLHPVSNSLFSYFALFVMRHAPEDWAVRLTMLLALLAMPLSALALERALREGRARSGSETSALFVALSALLAFNYFLYRGLFNFVLGVPLAVAALAVVVAVGSPRAGPLRLVGLALLACGLSLLAALAHPAALVFLLAAIPAACLAPGLARRVAGGLACVCLAYFALGSRIKGDHASSLVFASPLRAVWQFVRALGVTRSCFELVFALAILGCCAAAAWRALAKNSPEPRGAAARFPLWLALALACAYFVVPFEYGGAAGLNERIPLFVMLLILPYVSTPPKLARWLPLGFLVFASYTAAESARVDRLAQDVRTSSVTRNIPVGSAVSMVSLRVKYGAVSADLGRHLLGDLARQSDLVAGTVFCDHPAHVLRCTERVPNMPDLSGVQDFEHLTAAEQERALGDPASGIRRSFDTMRERARGSRYLVVLHAPELDRAFARYVLLPLHARLWAGKGELVSAYELGGQ
jgi:hypothetical protein